MAWSGIGLGGDEIGQMAVIWPVDICPPLAELAAWNPDDRVRLEVVAKLVRL